MKNGESPCISEKHRYIFVHIPKTGGTSISSQIKSHSPLAADRKLLNFKKHEKFLRLERHFSRGNLNINDFLIFTCVRQPHDRLFSHWFGHVSEEYKSFLKTNKFNGSTIEKSFNAWMKSGYSNMIQDRQEYKFIKNPMSEWLKGKTSDVCLSKFYFFVTDTMNEQWPEFVEIFRKHTRGIANKSKYTVEIGDKLPVINARSSLLYKVPKIKNLYDKESREIFLENNERDLELYKKILEENKRRANVSK